MADFTIGVWTTYELYHHWKNSMGADIAGQAIWDYIVKNVEDEGGYTVNVELASEHPNPPHEDITANWEDYYSHPCTGESTYYNDLHEWFQDWHSCNGTKHDIDLIATDYYSTYGLTSGNTSDGFFCSAEASEVGALHNASWSERGPEMRYSQMYATVLHEIGHAITEQGTDGCVSGSWNEEYSAYTYIDTQDGTTYNFTSPLVTWKDTNECCTDMNYNSNYDKAFDREYSDCIVNHIRSMSGNSL